MHPQVFDNTPAALDGTVAAGDEITGVNGRSIKGKTKVEVAKMIQEVKVRAAAGPPACPRAWKGGPALSQLPPQRSRVWVTSRLRVHSVDTICDPGLVLGLGERVGTRTERSPSSSSQESCQTESLLRAGPCVPSQGWSRSWKSEVKLPGSVDIQ